MVPATASPPAIPYANRAQVLKGHTSCSLVDHDEGETDAVPPPGQTYIAAASPVV